MLRVGELEALKWRDFELLTDMGGDIVLRVGLPRSQTDQYNERHAKVLKSLDLPLCPVTDFSRWPSIRSPGSQEDDPISNLATRVKLARTLKRAAISQNLGRAKSGAHSLRAGGASLKFAMCF